MPEGRSFERQLTPDIDSAGPFPHGRKKRMRSWAGWNTSSLKNADGTEAWLDSAGFVAMNLTNGFLWSPEEYIFGLCAAYPWARFSSLDQCVEPEIRSEEHTSELQSLMRISYAVFCLKKTKQQHNRASLYKITTRIDKN